MTGLMAALILSVAATSPLAAAKAMKPLEIKQRYLEVLGVLASGDLEQSLAGLLELEQAVVGDQQAWRYVDNLWRAKLQVIRDLLASQSPEMLRPIIVLHHDAYFRYSEMERAHLAQHSRTMAAELARIYAERAGTPRAKIFSGWVLTSFGAYLWSPSNIGASADLFYLTFMVDPGTKVALRGLAAAWERSGNYEYLQKALALEPGDPQLGLRMALCQLRYPEGYRLRALGTLDKLTDPQNPAWIRSIAYQELARVQLADDDRAAAESTIRSGLQALPGDQQISLQLAAILDADRRRSEALSVLAAIEIHGWERESARQTYDFWVPPDLEGVRKQLREQMVEGDAVLRAALEAA